MNKDANQLTPAEWHLMECLWEKDCCSGREAVEYLSDSVGWSRSTTLTMLRRMTEKGFIGCREAEGIRVYSPLIQREEAVLRETDSFLSRVYRGSVSMMLSAITKKHELSQEEIDQLYAILQNAAEETSHD